MIEDSNNVNTKSGKLAVEEYEKRLEAEGYHAVIKKEPADIIATKKTVKHGITK